MDLPTTVKLHCWSSSKGCGTTMISVLVWSRVEASLAPWQTGAATHCRFVCHPLSSLTRGGGCYWNEIPILFSFSGDIFSTCSCQLPPSDSVNHLHFFEDLYVCVYSCWSKEKLWAARSSLASLLFPTCWNPSLSTCASLKIIKAGELDWLSQTDVLFCCHVLKVCWIWSPLSLLFHSLSADMFVDSDVGHHGDGLDNRHKQRYEEENEQGRGEMERERRWKGKWKGGSQIRGWISKWSRTEGAAVK